MPTNETMSSSAGSEDRESMREMLHRMATPQKVGSPIEQLEQEMRDRLLAAKRDKDLALAGIRTKPSDDFLRGKFDSHKVTEAQAASIQRVKLAFYEAAKVVRDECPCCPEMTRAFNHLEEGCFLAVAGIAREKPAPTS